MTFWIHSVATWPSTCLRYNQVWPPVAIGECTSMRTFRIIFIEHLGNTVMLVSKELVLCKELVSASLPRSRESWHLLSGLIVAQIARVTTFYWTGKLHTTILILTEAKMSRLFPNRHTLRQFEHLKIVFLSWNLESLLSECSKQTSLNAVNRLHWNA